MSSSRYSAATLQTLLATHAQQEGALLPLLHAVQDKFGYIPSEAVAPIATALNLSRAEVHGVITYYHHFRSSPPGKRVIQICRAESCQACGGEALLAQAALLTGCDVHSTRADQAVTLEPVYCLGLCAASPAMQVGERLYGRMDSAKLKTLLQSLELTT